jgi:DNA modification methylase
MYEAKILVGDVRERLADIADGSVRTCVTSPPYWGLRDYGHDGQIGLEDSVTAYVDQLVEVFREVRRVLTDDGTLWLNLGDSYAGASLSRASNNGRAGFGNEREGTFSRLGDGLKQKDLIGVPWRVAFALQADGWYLRQDIIWSKPNPMPESVTDRCTKAHEYVFLLSKSPKYFFDADAIREPAVSVDDRRNGQGRQTYDGKRAENDGLIQQSFVTVTDTRNKRSVWSVTTRPFAGAHFAVMPEALAEPCVLAGSAPGDTVLDPFSGAATVGVVATRNQRNYVGCELNPDYVAIAEKRLHDEGGMFVDLVVD